jgi:exosome complex RNA-binding protein Rrp42 (RNase PH superfamily)
MAKVTITLEDTSDKPGMVTVACEFEPAVATDSFATPAQSAAAELLKHLQRKIDGSTNVDNDPDGDHACEDLKGPVCEGRR